MLPKNLRTLKRSISERILAVSGRQQKTEQAPVTPSKVLSATAADDDPYREILSRYNDNVSHLVLHGSSIRSMTK